MATKPKVVTIYRSTRTQRFGEGGKTVTKEPGDEVNLTGTSAAQISRMLQLGLIVQELEFAAPPVDSEKSTPAKK